MPRKVLVTSMSALILCTQTACVTKAPDTTCTVAGVKYLPGDASAAEICRSFKERLGQTMADAGKEGGAAGLKIALEVSQRGSLTAKVTSQGDDGLKDYPEIAIDVMDRPLVRQDMDKLADAVAQQLIAG